MSKVVFIITLCNFMLLASLGVFAQSEVKLKIVESEENSLKNTIEANASLFGVVDNVNTLYGQ
jgi:hypothetical protein